MACGAAFPDAPDPSQADTATCSKCLKPTAGCGQPAGELFQGQYDRARGRIGDAEPAAKVFKRIAKRIERGDHVWPRLDARVHVFPLGDEAVRAVTRLYDVS